MAFWDFNAGAALTAPCDDDVQQLCGSPQKGKSVYTIGVVGRCLTKQLAGGKPLSPQCRKLVSVAAPKDIRVSIQVRMLAQLCRAPCAVQLCCARLRLVTANFVCSAQACMGGWWT